MDLIEGVVLNVIDGDTFDLDVDRVGMSNQYAYNDVERERLAGGLAPEPRDRGGLAAKACLRAKRPARVAVRARDRYGRIVGDVKIVA